MSAFRISLPISFFLSSSAKRRLTLDVPFAYSSVMSLSICEMRKLTLSSSFSRITMYGSSIFLRFDWSFLNSAIMPISGRYMK